MITAAYHYRNPLLESDFPSAAQPEVDQTYQDLAPARPQLSTLIETAQAQQLSQLYLIRLTDIGDTLPLILARLAQLEALGVTITATQPPYRTGTPLTGSALLTLHQRLQHQRLCQGHARRRLRAAPPPGKAPYGYRRGKDCYVLDKATAPVVKAFFEQFLLYGALRGAVRYIESRYGKKISPSTGRRWLSSPVYRGHTAYKDGGVVRNTHPAILLPDEAAQVDRLLRRSQFLPPRTASAARSLSGLVACQSCSSAMKITRVSSPRRQQDYLYLQPVSCRRQPRCPVLRYASVLTETIETICADLPTAIAQQPKIPAQGKATAIAAIEQKQTALTQLPSLVREGVLDQTTADLRAYTLNTEIAAAQQALAQLPPVNLQELVKAVTLPQFWQDLSEAERRFFFREFIQKIWVSPSGATPLKLTFVF